MRRIVEYEAVDADMHLTSDGAAGVLTFLGVNGESVAVQMDRRGLEALCGRMRDALDAKAPPSRRRSTDDNRA